MGMLSVAVCRVLRDTGACRTVHTVYESELLPRLTVALNSVHAALPVAAQCTPHQQRAVHADKLAVKHGLSASLYCQLFLRRWRASV